MKSIRVPLFFLMFALPSFALPTTGCTRNAEKQIDLKDGGELNGKLTLTGSSTVAPLATEIAKRFEDLHSGVRIDVQTGGSGKGIADARIGAADIGMASRPLKPDEAELTAYPIAADGVGLIVHNSSAIRELTADQVIAIYTDEINNWQDVGGDDKEITVVHKAEGRATLEVFLSHLGIENPAIKADVIVGDNEHGVKTVAGAEGAIGYVSIRRNIALALREHGQRSSSSEELQSSIETVLRNVGL